MTGRSGPNPGIVILAIIAVWAGYLLIQQPAPTPTQRPLDWGNIVWFPLLIVGLLIASRYVSWRRTLPGPEEMARHGVGEALASGLLWGIIKGIQEYWWFDGITIGPLISGTVVFVAVLLGNWLLPRILGRRQSR